MSELLCDPNITVIMGGRGKFVPGLAATALELSGAERPNVLLIPTSAPSPEDFGTFVDECTEEFGGLGANVTLLHEYDEAPTDSAIADRFGEATLIWSAFGNTLKAMEHWRVTGISPAVRQAVTNGVIIGGGSAGMLASTANGHSDSMQFYADSAMPDGWSYINVPGLGFVDATGCPHYNQQAKGHAPRREAFHDMLRTDPGLSSKPAIGVDNEAALILRGNEFTVIRRPGHPDTAHFVGVVADGNTVWEESLPANQPFQPLPVL